MGSMTTLSKRLGGLVLVLMVAVFLWYARYAQLPDVLYAGTTESENTLIALVEGGQLRKYQINKLLPAGTTVKVWMEAYESGTRVDDVAVSTAQLKSQQRGICFYSLEQEGKVATAIDGFPESVGRGSYPLERWFETTSAMGGSGWGGDLFDGGYAVEMSARGLPVKWLEPGQAPRLVDDPAQQQEFINDCAFVYLLKVQVMRPGR